MTAARRVTREQELLADLGFIETTLIRSNGDRFDASMEAWGRIQDYLIERKVAAALPAPSEGGLRVDATEQAVAELVGVESALDMARERLRKVMPLLSAALEAAPVGLDDVEALEIEFTMRLTGPGGPSQGRSRELPRVRTTDAIRVFRETLTARLSRETGREEAGT